MPTSGIQNITPVGVDAHPTFAATVARTKLKGLPVANQWAPTTSAAALSDNTLALCLVHIPVKTKISGIQFEQTTQGNTTDDQENRVGIYSVGDTLTLLASSATSGTTWESAAGVVSVAFSSAVTVDPGLYYTAGLTNWSAVDAAPQVRHVVLPSANYAALGNEQGIVLGGTVATQNTLPATTALSGVSAATSIPILLPY